MLTAEGVPAPKGNIWHFSVIHDFLMNEKYSGNMLLGKTFVEDHLTKKQRINRGEMPKCLVENSHQAIIDPETFAAVKVYTDEGISGVSTKRREGFNEMIEDALAGKIDLIVTKSVSRFARNTVDTLTTIRELKAHGIEVFFEKEGIYTFDGKGELLLTIMSSLAQEESRSISENVAWGIRKSFSDGKVMMPYGAFLGYCDVPIGMDWKREMLNNIRMVGE